MVRDDAPIEPEGNDSILSSGFSLPEDSVRRALPASLIDAPNLDVFLAFAGDDVVGTVTVIHQGETSGIWSMATDATRQRSAVYQGILDRGGTLTARQAAALATDTVTRDYDQTS